MIKRPLNPQFSSAVLEGRKFTTIREKPCSGSPSRKPVSMPKPPSQSLEITTNGCTVRVYGKRSTKGWNVTRTGGARYEHQGHRKSKDDAIQLAIDCCEPGTAATYSVKPANL